jgi:hypothetical protein
LPTSVSAIWLLSVVGDGFQANVVRPTFPAKSLAVVAVRVLPPEGGPVTIPGANQR